MVPTLDEERVARGPRPLQFVRIRVYGIGAAEYLRRLLSDDIDRIYEDLAEARKNDDGGRESELRDEMKYATDLRRDLETSMMELIPPSREE